jgi:polyhydroxybutyrate depolymerase
MLRFMALALAFVVSLGTAVFSGAHIISAIERTSTTSTNSVKIGNLTRTWETIAPTKALPKKDPIVIVLAGIGATTQQEINRDQFVPYVDADEMEAVYPVAIHESWNAIGCCEYASAHNINDIGFIEALVKKVDPGHVHPLILVGYSNGGRLAYRFACTDPWMFDYYAIVKADPMPDCKVTKPVDIIQLDSLDDTFVPYAPGYKGDETPPATVQVGRLRAADKCTSKSTKVTPKGTGYNMDYYQTWESCANGKEVGFGVWKAGVHQFPRPPYSNPGASQVIWAFFTRTAIAPEP